MRTAIRHDQHPPRPLDPALALAGLALVGCLGPPLDSPVPVTVEVSRRYVAQNVRNQVDLLFLVDNSNSMDAMQVALTSKLGQFFKPFQDLAAQGTYADLNIGVITSDYGAGATGGTGCTPSGPQGGGDRARLQGVGRRAPPWCQRPRGANFLHYVFGPDGAAHSNLPAGQGLVDTFTCMASVGSDGCGFEHPLEAVRAALHDPIPENQGGSPADPGFLREDALLVVAFLTNEDDASAPPDTDVFDRTKVRQYGYEDSYSRQTRFAVMCGSPLAFPPYGDSNGPLAACVPAPNPDGEGPGKQYDVQRYIDFFTRPAREGGVKANPLDVMLVGIDAPEAPFQVMLANPSVAAGYPYRACDRLDEAHNPPCVPVLQHSCTGAAPDPSRPDFRPVFGDPAVRLNTVIRSVPQHQITSICADDYTPALADAARLIVTTLTGGCLATRFPRDGASGALRFDCTVEDQTVLDDGTRRVTDLPRCDPFMPGAAHAVTPCWMIAPADACKDLSPDGVGLVIDRGRDAGGRPIAAPPHTTALVTCATHPAG